VNTAINLDGEHDDTARTGDGGRKHLTAVMVILLPVR
jgi:hypothetical protein